MRILIFHARSLLFVIMVLFAPTIVGASRLNIPPETTEAIRLMYSGHPDQAIQLAHKLEADRPEHPLGYLVEANAIWWKIYCVSSERKYNTIDVWNRSRTLTPEDTAHLALADKVVRLSEASIAKSDTAEMELYAGMGYAMRARLLGVHDQKMATARAGVEGRKHLLRCLELDPDMPDAYLGLGLYNYYVDALSSMAKVLRFFMGIPGGDRRVGLRQLETASMKGELTRTEARFNLAKNLRNLDFDYSHAAEVAAPLISYYPDNPLFLLLMGDIAGKLGHNEEAASHFRAAAAAPAEDPSCGRRVQELVREALAKLETGNRK